LPTPPTFDAPINGPCPNIVMTFCVEKPEWHGYSTVKQFEDMSVRFDRVHERDGRTDRRTDRQTLRDGIGRADA